MLRNAGRAIGGEGTKTLLVTHSRELAEQADVILHLENGELNVRRAI
jgi:ABC-type lipoprotein export system ATPase subunit